MYSVTSSRGITYTVHACGKLTFTERDGTAWEIINGTFWVKSK